VLTTKEAWRFNYPAGLTEPDLHNWEVGMIEDCSYYVCVSALSQDGEDPEDIAGANFWFFSSRSLIDFLSAPNWTAQRVDLFLRDLDNLPDFNNFRIKSIHLGYAAEPMNPTMELALCRFETIDGVEHHIHGDLECEDPPVTPMRKCYFSRTDC